MGEPVRPVIKKIENAVVMCIFQAREAERGQFTA